MSSRTSKVKPIKMADQPNQGQDQEPAEPEEGWHPNQPTVNEPSNQADGAPGDDSDGAPGDDLDEDENTTEPAVALPADISKGYSGGDYANVDFDDSDLVPPPPTHDKAKQNSERPAEEFSGGATINQEEIRDALLQHVSEHCCYGSGPAKEMTFKKTIPSNALHYELETFCESRTTKREFEPYTDTQVDSNAFGRPPSVWDMECHPDDMFFDHIKLLRVPHTEYVAECHNCDARGYVKCWRCGGRGDIRCEKCRGSGRVSYTTPQGKRRYKNCPMCHRGRRQCWLCKGEGTVTCKACQGRQQLLHFIQLSVNYETHADEYIHEKSDLPDEFIRDVNGDDIFAQEDFAVWPITKYPVAEICSNSENLISSHRQLYQREKQLRQRHWMRSVPVSEVHYKYNDVETRFWVYGFEKKVHAPDYPAQCCWGCNIL